MNPAQAVSAEFRDALTGQVMKWKFPDLHRSGAATVQIETTTEAGPQSAPQVIFIGGIQASLPPPPSAPQIVKPKSVSVVPGIVAAPPAEAPAPPPAAETPAAPVPNRAPGAIFGLEP
jgi:hypothetical protein